MKKVDTAVIGGTGLYQLGGITVNESIDVNTPFGDPSDSIKIVQIGGKEVAFLPRHGAGHRLLPTEIPVKANIWALKKLGVERILSVSAVGSLKEQIEPRDIIIPDQIIDRTRLRENTYFGNGLVGHVSFADPFCKTLATRLNETISSAGYKVHRNETYICMEGPLFSTRAESNLYRRWGGGVIGMTALPEAKLAREAEICYVLMALCTDYDCWKQDGEDVTIDMVVENLSANTQTAGVIVQRFIQNLPEDMTCTCHSAAQYAFITEKGSIPDAVKNDLSLFYGKYWNE
jgi:5'-methylthioadenosine phosphorylase